MRFFVRKGPAGWMVWDRHAKAPAMFERRPAVRLREAEAMYVGQWLNEGRNPLMASPQQAARVELRPGALLLARRG